MRQQTIYSLAILKANWEDGRTYIENFVPFALECLLKSKDPEVSLPELQQAISDEFGLKIPQGALKTILRHIARSGYISIERGIYRKDDIALQKVGIARQRDDVLRNYRELIGKLLRFCADQYSCSWKEEDAENALIGFIKHRSPPILAAAVDGGTLIAPTKMINNSDYLISAFILELYKNDSKGFEFLETIVKGNMLAGALYFPNIGEVNRGLEKLCIYLDTNFLLRALGYANNSQRDASRELMDLIYELGGSLHCFTHNFHEIRNILEATSHKLKNRTSISTGYGEVLDHFIRVGATSSDVELEIARLEKNLRNLRVNIKDKPSHSRVLGLDEKALEAILAQVVGYSRRDTLLNDLDSITAIFRMRSGQRMIDLETCRALFVTTNTALEKASKSFFEKEINGSSVPLLFMDHMLTTLLWLKKPTAAPALPRKRIIADCYAALNPSDDLWRKYLVEINKLEEDGAITTDDYNLLRFSMESKRALMDVTYGESSAFTEGTVKEVLARSIAFIRSNLEEELKEEKRQTGIARERANEAELNNALRQQKLLLKAKTFGEKVGLILSRCAAVFFLLLLVILFFLTYPRDANYSQISLMEFLQPGAYLILAILSIVNLWKGITLRRLIRKFDVYISKKVERTFLKILNTDNI